MKQSGRTSLPRGRVVVLARDPSLAPALSVCDRESVFAASPLQAAAELLAEPTSAMVIDLNLLPKRHERLLKLAVEQGVDTITFGNALPGVTLDEFAAEHVKNLSELPAALRRLGNLETPPTDQANAPATVPPTPAIAPSPATPLAAAVKLTPAKSPAAPGDGAPPAKVEPELNLEELGLGGFSADAAPTSPATPAVAEPAAPAAEAGKPSSILTPEEIAALLEREL